ncbi:MAG TPA: hypothetical protein VFZ00_04890 [Solirubrobacter sp.]|nr:hypothetical protein [Solirubrobacter sp.]
MNALCRSYDSTEAAEQAVQALLDAGVPGDDVRLLMGAEIHDARRELRGGFAAAVDTRERVGAFAGEGPRRDAPRGSFAGDGAARGEGVFANADRDVVVSYSDGREHSRVAGHGTLKRLLVDAGLDDEVAEADVHALHDGRVLVLVTGAVEKAAAVI